MKVVVSIMFCIIMGGVGMFIPESFKYAFGFLAGTIGSMIVNSDM